MLSFASPLSAPVPDKQFYDYEFIFAALERRNRTAIWAAFANETRDCRINRGPIESLPGSWPTRLLKSRESAGRRIKFPAHAPPWKLLFAEDASDSGRVTFAISRAAGARSRVIAAGVVRIEGKRASDVKELPRGSRVTASAVDSRPDGY
jgi:hypothetical protein